MSPLVKEEPQREPTTSQKRTPFYSCFRCLMEPLELQAPIARLPPEGSLSCDNPPVLPMASTSDWFCPELVALDYSYSYTYSAIGCLARPWQTLSDFFEDFGPQGLRDSSGSWVLFVLFPRSPKSGHTRAGRSDFRNERCEPDTRKMRTKRKVPLTPGKKKTGV